MIGDADIRDLNDATRPWLPVAPDIDRELAIRARLAARHRVRLAIKRVFDILFSATGLLLLLPLLVVVAALIKLTSAGPILFWQDRVGQHGRTFRLCKFRTLYADRCDPSGVQQALAGDPRVTPVGSVLRRRSIDELPQLFNVLRGEMSLVGPRAQVAEMTVCGLRYHSAVPHYHRRHQMRPGITGLAQVRGLRGPVLDMVHANRRVEADLEYIDGFTIGLDLAILMRTVIQETVRGSGV